MLPAARITSRRQHLNNAASGVTDAALRVFCAANTGVSATFSRTYKAMAMSTALNRNGIRQPQWMNALLASPIVRFTIRNSKLLMTSPVPTPIWVNIP